MSKIRKMNFVKLRLWNVNVTGVETSTGYVEKRFDFRRWLYRLFGKTTNCLVVMSTFCLTHMVIRSGFESLLECVCVQIVCPPPQSYFCRSCVFVCKETFLVPRSYPCLHLWETLLSGLFQNVTVPVCSLRPDLSKSINAQEKTLQLLIVIVLPWIMEMYLVNTHYHVYQISEHIFLWADAGCGWLGVYDTLQLYSICSVCMWVL